jgi:outer membrane protein OmpA-like peptidoglycan-associated protein
MRKLFWILTLLMCGSLQAQKEILSEILSDCDGATNILEPGQYSLQFTGKSGIVDDLMAYPSLSNIKESNSIWISFIAPFHGTLSLNATLSTGKLQMIIFEEGQGNICQEIQNGSSEIKRMITTSTSPNIGLDKKTSESKLYPLELKEGQEIRILFNTDEKSKEKLKLHFNFEMLHNINTLSSDEYKIVDKRDDDFAPYISIIIRDVTTGKPIISNLTVEGIKDITALYVGSDFFFTLERTGKLKLKCDAVGYFFADREEDIKSISETNLTIWLEPLGQGKSMQIEEIEFYPGTSDFMPTSEAKLRRLRDFLALNAEVKIEIQGHVFSLGENSFAGQKLSEARAKRVLNYLVDNGISKERLTTIGFGNTKPIYPKPKFAYEEQANRRVEIKVL